MRLTQQIIYVWGSSLNLLTIRTANTGDGIAFVAGDNVEAMRILSTGYVGIGTNDPKTFLHVYGGASGATALSGYRLC
ncbi:hypothetical protein MASR2M39_30210 [Ignavibacteriales bacterium]